MLCACFLDDEIKDETGVKKSCPSPEDSLLP